MKVIAIIEKPANCSRCPFNHVEISYEECRLLKKQLSAVESLQIPEWCELKPLPQKGFGDEDDIEQTSYFDGWNECLDEIMGETE